MTAFTTQHLQDLLTYPTRDPQWKQKLLIGSLFMLGGYFIPILPWLFVAGYMAQLTRTAAESGSIPTALPEWNDWGKLLLDGLKLSGAMIIYYLPVILAFGVGYALMFGASFLPLFQTAGHTSQQLNPADIFVPQMIGMAAFWVLFAVGLLFSLAIGFVSPAIVSHVVVTGQFGAAFRFGEWWKIFRANIGGFLIAFAMVMGLSMVMGIGLEILYFTVILCCLIPLVMSPLYTYLMFVSGALFGGVYREGRDKLAGPIEIMPESQPEITPAA